MKWDWKAVLGVGISLALVWWILRGVDVVEVAWALRRARWDLLLLAVGVATSGFLVRALRWKVLLHPLHEGTSLHPRFAAVNIGFMANNLLPARAGEFARAYAISRLEPVSISGALGSLVVERFLDAVAILLLLGVALAAPSFPAGATVAGQPLGSAVAGVVLLLSGLVCVLLVLIVWPSGCLRLLRRVVRFLPDSTGRSVLDVTGKFLRGLGSLRDLRLFLLGFLWSVGFWAWHAVSFWLGFLAFGIDLGYTAALFVQAIVALGVAIPSAPGFFGTFHAAAVIGLQEVYGAEAGATLAFAFGYHLGGFIPVTLLGLFYVWKLGLSLKEVGRSEELVERELEVEVHP